MIYKWNELSYKDFKEYLLDFIVGKEDYVKGKILEVVCPIAVWVNPSPNRDRVFFGKGINLLEWKDSNKNYINTIHAFNNLFDNISIDDIIEKENMGMCKLEDGIPKINPITLEGEQRLYKSLISTYFGEHFDDNIFTAGDCVFPLWYCREGDYIVVDKNASEVPENKRLVKFRSLDLDDWKNIISSGELSRLGDGKELDTTKIIGAEQLILKVHAACFTKDRC